MDTGQSEVLVFKLFRSKIATPNVLLPGPEIIPTLDIIKLCCPHYFPTDKVFLHVQWMKEAFHTGIIVVADLCAHTAAQIMPLQHYLRMCWTALTSALCVNNNVLRFIPPRHHLQGYRDSDRITEVCLSLLPLTSRIPAATVTRSMRNIALMLIQPDVIK